MQTIKCPDCDSEFNIAEGLTQDIRAELLKEQHISHQKALLQQKEAMEVELKEKIEKAKDLKEAEQAEENRQLKTQLQEDKKITEGLRKQISDLIAQLKQSENEKQSAKNQMELDLIKQREQIRQEVLKEADEKDSLKRAELEKKLADTTKSLNEAKRRAEQGLNTNQGEVLELKLEDYLKSAFPTDKIEPVKTGQRGADIKQFVNNQKGEEVGLILWEVKNAKWSAAWIDKFKNDVRQAGASIGILVSRELPTDYNDFHSLSSNLWLVKPNLATHLAKALRVSLVQVREAHQMNVGKDQKLENLFQFITSPAFRHRIEAILDYYSRFQKELEKEKKQAQLRWSRQEQNSRLTIDNVLGMYGDLQGITNELPELSIEKE